MKSSMQFRFSDSFLISVSRPPTSVDENYHADGEGMSLIMTVFVVVKIPIYKKQHLTITSKSITKVKYPNNFAF